MFLVFFVVVFFVIYSGGQIGSTNVQEENMVCQKISDQEKILPCDLAVFICLTLHLFFSLKSPHIPAIIYPEDYCPCLLVIKSCDKMNTPIK